MCCAVGRGRCRFSCVYASTVSVSRGFLTEFSVEADESTKEQLIVFMGQIHGIVVDVCEEYFGSNRRHVYQTPKSFLSFLTKYKQLYAQKLAEIRTKEERVNMGLKKLVQGASDVDAMKGEKAVSGVGALA